MTPSGTFRLRLLGSPSIARADGTLLAGRAAQRHRIALLALLALAPGGGVRREKLQASLWPESDAEHARQLLNQAVYSLRKELGEEAILSAGDELRFNPLVVECDALAFEEALAAGELERAAGLYGGPVLDGFFLSDAAEFEHWLEGVRQRLAGGYARALESLAAAALAAGRPDQAVEWWKARAVHDPYDSRVALRLMEALDASGNRAGALQHAGIHQRLLQEEFGAEPDPQVLALAARLRSEPASRPGPPPGQSAPPVPAHAPPPPALPEVSGRAPELPAATASPGGRPRRTPRRAGLLVVLLALAVLGTIWIGTRPADPPSGLASDASIAVLPLQNLSGDPRDAALADGMTDALIAVLAQADGLRVIASTSVSGFRDRPADVRRIADTLGVGHILEGSFQRVGSRLRVQLRLVDARDGSTRWSERYDREFADVFAVQDDIARSVARELGLRLGTAPVTRVVRPPTRNVAAYELYLRGSDRSLLRNDSTARLGLRYFQQAVELDSSYAAAWAGMGRMYGRVSSTVRPADRGRTLELAEAAARRAVALDDSLAEAHATLGVLRMASFDFASAERHLERAIALDPANALIHEWMVSLQLWTERPMAALAHAERALELDPLSPTAHAEVARALLGNDRCDEALAVLRRLEGLRPPLLRVSAIAAECHGRKGRWAEAIAVLRPNTRPGERVTSGLLGYFLARAGERGEAVRLRAALEERARQGVGDAYEVALVAAGLGDLDGSFAWLDRALADHSLRGGPGNQAHLLLTGPLLADLRRDPRFEPFRQRLGLPAVPTGGARPDR